MNIQDINKDMTKGTNLAVHECILPVSPARAHQLFIEIVWLGGGFPFPLSLMGKPGVHTKASDAKSGKGSVRTVPSGLMPFISEHNLESKLGEFFHYQCKGLTPFSYHRGIVNFYDAGDGHTRVCWKVSYTPRLGMSAIAYAFINGSFPLFLAELRRAAQKESKVSQDRSLMSSIIWILVFIFLGITVGKIISILKAVPQPPPIGYLDVLGEYYKSTPEINAFVQKTNFLVIGGTGFTGSSIVHELRARGAKSIKVFGRSFPPVVEYPYSNRPEDKYPIKGIQYVKGDVMRVDDLKKAFVGVDVVFHTAAMYGSPPFGMLDGGDITESINVGGMKNILEAAGEKKVKQVIYTSSCDTTFSHLAYKNANEILPYGESGIKDQNYSTGILAVGDHYARTKIMAEKLLLSSNGKNGIATLALRPNGIYGPGEFVNFPKAILPAWFMGIWPFYFDKDQRIDWSCVGSLAAAHILGAYKLETEKQKVSGKAYYITDGDQEMNTGAFKVFAPVANALGIPVKLWIPIPPQWVPLGAYGLEYSLNWFKQKTGIHINPFMTYKEGMKAITTHTHDISAAKKDLGYKPLFTTDECLAWFGDEFARRYGVKN